MKIKEYIFSIFPWFFPKKRKKVRHNLELLLQERWQFVTEFLGVQNLQKPKLRVWTMTGPQYFRGLITVSYSIHPKGEQDRTKTFDHEIAHHIQHRKNPNIKDNYSFEFFSFVYWAVTGKVKFGLANRAFQEGFASYVAYLTSGKITPRVEKGIWMVQEQRRLKMLLKDPEVLPYVLGYLGFLAIAETTSKQHAIQLGLSSNISSWNSEREKSITVKNK